MSQIDLSSPSKLETSESPNKKYSNSDEKEESKFNTIETCLTTETDNSVEDLKKKLKETQAKYKREIACITQELKMYKEELIECQQDKEESK